MAASALSVLLGRMAANNMGEKYQLPNYGYEATDADTSTFESALSDLNKSKSQSIVQPSKPIASSATPVPERQAEPNWIRDTAASILPHLNPVGAMQGVFETAGEYIPAVKSVTDPIASFFAGANIAGRLMETADIAQSKVFDTPRVFQPYKNQEIFTADGKVNASGIAYAAGDLASAVALMMTGAGAAEGAATAAKYAPMLQKVSEAVPAISKLPVIGEIIGGQTLAGAIGTGLGTGAHTLMSEANETLEGKKSVGSLLGHTAFSTLAGTMYGGGANPTAGLMKKIVGESAINAAGAAVERLPELLMNDIPLLPKSAVYTALEQKLKAAAASGDSTQIAQAQGELDATSRFAGMQWQDGLSSVLNSYLGNMAVQGLTGAVLPAAVHGMQKLAPKAKIPVAPGAPVEQAAEAATAQSAGTVNAQDDILNRMDAAKAEARKEEVSAKVDDFIKANVNTREAREAFGQGIKRQEIKQAIETAIERDPSVEQTLNDVMDTNHPATIEDLKQHIMGERKPAEAPVAEAVEPATQEPASQEPKIEMLDELENMNKESLWHYYGIPPKGMEGMDEDEISKYLNVPLHPDAAYEPEVPAAREVRYDPNTRETYNRAPVMLEHDELGNLTPTEAAKDVPMVVGKPTTIFFNTEQVPGHYVVVPADYIQPTHNYGARNQANFIENPQDKMGDIGKQNIDEIELKGGYNPEFGIRTDATAFEGIPVASPRLESIQGATRQNLQKRLSPEKFELSREQIIKNAKAFGMDSPEQLQALQTMPNPTIQRVIGGSDEELSRIARITQDTIVHQKSAADRSRARLSILDPENKYKGRNVEEAFNVLHNIMSKDEFAEQTLTSVLSNERNLDKVAKALTDNPKFYVGAIDAKEGRENLIYDLKNLLFGADADTLRNLESVPSVNRAVEGSLGQILALSKDPIMADIKSALTELHTYHRETSAMPAAERQTIDDYFRSPGMFGHTLEEAYADRPNVVNLVNFFAQNPSQKKFRDLLVRYAENRSQKGGGDMFGNKVQAMDSAQALQDAMETMKIYTSKEAKRQIENLVKNGIANNSPGLLSLSGAMMLPDNDDPLYAGSSMTNRDARIVLQILAVAGLASSPVAMTLIRRLESAAPKSAAEFAESRIIRPRETSVINIPLTDRQLKAVTQQKFGEHKVPLTPDQITPHDAQNLAGKISAAGLTDEAYAYYHAFLDKVFEPDYEHMMRIPKQEMVAHGFVPESFHEDLIDLHGMLSDGKISQADYDSLVEKHYADVLEKYRVEADEDLRFTEQGNDEMEYWGSLLLLRNATEGKYPMSPAMQKLVVTALDETQPAYRSVARRISDKLQDLNIKKAKTGDNNYRFKQLKEVRNLIEGGEGEFGGDLVLKNTEEPTVMSRLMLAALDIDHTEEPNWKAVVSGLLSRDFSAFRNEFNVSVIKGKGNAPRRYKVTFGENLQQAMKEDFRHAIKNMRSGDWRESYLQRSEVEGGMPVESNTELTDLEKQGYAIESEEIAKGEPTKAQAAQKKYEAQKDYAYLLQQARAAKDIEKLETAMKDTDDIKGYLYKTAVGKEYVNPAAARGEMKAWDAMIDKGIAAEAEDSWDDITKLYNTMKPHQREAFDAYMDTHIQQVELQRTIDELGGLPPRNNTRPYSGTLSASFLPFGEGSWKAMQYAFRNGGISLFNAGVGYITASMATDENSRPLGMTRDEFRNFVAMSGFILGIPHLRAYVMSKVHGTTFSAALDTMNRGYNMPAKMEMESTAEQKVRQMMFEQAADNLKSQNLSQADYDKAIVDEYGKIRSLNLRDTEEFKTAYKSVEMMRSDAEKGFAEGIFKKLTPYITGKGFLDKIGHKYVKRLVDAEIKAEAVGRKHNETITQLDEKFRTHSDADQRKAVAAAIDYDRELSAIAADKTIKPKAKVVRVLEKTAELEKKHFASGGKAAFDDLQKMLSETRKIEAEAFSVKLFSTRHEDLPASIAADKEKIGVLQKSILTIKQEIANTDKGSKQGLTTYKALVEQLKQTDALIKAHKLSAEQKQYLYDLPARSDLYHHISRWHDQNGTVKYKVQGLDADGKKVMHLYKKFESEGAAEKWLIDFDKKSKDKNHIYYGMPRPERIIESADQVRGKKQNISNMRMKIEDIVRVAYGHGTSNLATLGIMRDQIANSLKHLPEFQSLKFEERAAVENKIKSMVSADDLRSVLKNIWEPRIPHLESRKNISGWEPVEDIRTLFDGRASEKDHKAARDFVFGGINRTVTKSRQDLSKFAIRDEMLAQKKMLSENGLTHTQYFKWLMDNIEEGISGNQFGNMSAKTIKKANFVKGIVGGTKLAFNALHGIKNLTTGTISTLTEATMEQGLLRGGATFLSSAGDLARGAITGGYSSPKVAEAYKQLLERGIGETQFINSLLDKEISGKAAKSKMFLFSSKTEEYNNKLAAMVHAKIALQRGATVQEAMEYALAGRQRTQYSYNPWDNTILERKIKSIPGGGGIVATALMSSAFRATEHAASIYYRALKNPKSGAIPAMAFVLGATMMNGLYSTPFIGDAIKGINFLESVANKGEDETSLTKENSMEYFSRKLGDVMERFGQRRELGEKLLRDLTYGLGSTSTNINFASDNTLAGMLTPVALSSINTLSSIVQATAGNKSWKDVGLNAVKEVTQLNRGLRAGVQLAEGHALDNKLRQTSDEPFTIRDAAQEFVFGRTLKASEAVQTSMTGGSGIVDELSAQKYIKSVYSVPDLKVGHEKGKKAGQQLEELIAQAPKIRTGIIKEYEALRPQRLQDMEKVKNWMENNKGLVNWIDRMGGSEVAGNMKQTFEKNVLRRVEKYYTGVAAKKVLGDKAKFRPDKGTPDQIAIEYGLKSGENLAKKVGKQSEWRELLKRGKL